MTEPLKPDDTNDTKMPSESPNDRVKKKSRDDTEPENPDAMEYEVDSLVPRDIFGSAASSQQLVSYDETAPTNNNNNKNNANNDQDEELPDALPPTAKEPDSVDMTGDDSSSEGVPSSPNPFLANIDLSDDPIWNVPIRDANDLWKSDPDWHLEMPYTTGEIDGKTCHYDDSLEAQLRLASDYVVNHDASSAIATSEWFRLFAHAFSAYDDDVDEEDDANEELRLFRYMAIRLALSDPVDLFPSSSWKNGALTMLFSGHTAWAACYWMFGAPWKNREHWFATAAPALQGNLKRKASDRVHDSLVTKTVEFRPDQEAVDLTARKPAPVETPPPKAPNSSASAVSVVANDKDSAAKKPAINSMYLSKSLQPNPRHAKNVQAMKDVGRKHRTYVKLKFSKFTSDVTTEQAEEVATCFKSMMDKVWNVDSTTLVLAWKDGASAKPLRSRSEFPKSKDGLVGYLDNLWMQKGKSAYCRSLLSHDTPADQLFQDHGLQSWLEGLDLSLVVDRIQAKRIGNAGHLLGFHALAANTENLADAIQNQMAMRNISVEVRSEFVRFGTKKTASQRTNTKILQVYTAWDSTSRARRALVEIYSSKAKGLYPLGVQSRFIPNVNDTRFIRTPASLLAHTNSLKKHVKFMNNTGMQQCHTIIELDHYNTDVDMTLRQAIMHIFSPSMPNCTLFLAVDTSFYGDCVNFAYREELENEAINMITALPLFLFASLGRRSVWDWFTSDARHEASYYRWDMDHGIIPVDDMDVTNTKLASWEQLDDVDDDDDGRTESIIQPFRLLLDQSGDNAFNDNGTIRTQVYRDRPSADNDQDSTSTAGFEIVSHDDDYSQANLHSIDSTETSTTPSTLTRTPDKDALLEEMAEDPEMIAKFEAMMIKRQSLKAAQVAKDATTGTGGNGAK